MPNRMYLAMNKFSNPVCSNIFSSRQEGPLHLEPQIPFGFTFQVLGPWRSLSNPSTLMGPVQIFPQIFSQRQPSICNPGPTGWGVAPARMCGLRCPQACMLGPQFASCYLVRCGTLKNLETPNSNLAFKVVTKVYLSEQEDF